VSGIQVSDAYSTLAVRHIADIRGSWRVCLAQRVEAVGRSRPAGKVKRVGNVGKDLLCVSFRVGYTGK
jgi:hypothetical protein